MKPRDRRERQQPDPPIDRLKPRPAQRWKERDDDAYDNDTLSFPSNKKDK
jgi:hypothetical protein